MNTPTNMLGLLPFHAWHVVSTTQWAHQTDKNNDFLPWWKQLLEECFQKPQEYTLGSQKKKGFVFSWLYEHFSVKSGSWFCQKSPVCMLRWLSCHIPLQMWTYLQVCIMQQVKKMHLPTRQKSWDVQVMNAKEKKDRYSVIAFRLHRRLKSEPIAVQLYNVVSLVLRDQTTLKYSSHQSKGRVVIARYGCSSILKIQSSVTRVQ